MNQKILSKFFAEIVIQLETLSEADIKKLDSGEYSLGLKIFKKNETQNVNIASKEPDYSAILEMLNACESRESGYEILKTHFTNKKELEKFAKKINVYVMKQDKIDKVREKIIEGIVGATLRSNAIQNNDQ